MSDLNTRTSPTSHASALVLIAEDAWLGALYADQMASGADYLRCSARLRGIMGPHVAGLLEAGVSVALDFPACLSQTAPAILKSPGTCQQNDRRASSKLFVLGSTNDVSTASPFAYMSGFESQTT